MNTNVFCACEAGVCARASGAAELVDVLELLEAPLEQHRPANIWEETSLCWDPEDEASGSSEPSPGARGCDPVGGHASSPEGRLHLLYH